jgi:hypothetical protein
MHKQKFCSIFSLYYQILTSAYFGITRIKKLNSLSMVNNKLPEGIICVAMPQHMRLVAGFSPRRSVFAPRVVHVGFVVDKVALGRVFL